MMDLTDLETFVTAVQERSLSEAARRMFVSQPAVSARVRRLEGHVGESLLQRSGRGVEPTPAGIHLYERALPLLEQIRQLDQELGPTGPIRGRLAIGSTDLVAVYHLPAALGRLRREHPQLEVSVHVEGTATLLRLLEAGRIGLALGTLPVGGAAFEVTTLYTDPLQVVAPPDHPLSSKKSVSAASLTDQPWILHKIDSVTRQQVEGFFASKGLSMRTEMEISSPEAIKQLVQAGLGLSILPERSVTSEREQGSLSFIQIRGFRVDRSSGLIERRGVSPSRAALALRDILLAGR